MNILVILREYFRSLSTTIMDYFGLVNLHFKLTITSNARHHEHLKAFANYFKHYKINEHSRNSSGVLSVTFDHYHDYFGLRQSSYKLTITSNSRYRRHLKPFANSFEHYKINEHSRNSSGVLTVTFDHYHDYCGLRQSSYKLTITTNARYREHLNAFASSCELHKINEYSCNRSGVLSVTSTINKDYFSLRQSSYKPIISSNACDREHLKAFANLCTL